MCFDLIQLSIWIHRQNVIHADLKPENILFEEGEVVCLQQTNHQKIWFNLMDLKRFWRFWRYTIQWSVKDYFDEYSEFIISYNHLPNKKYHEHTIPFLFLLYKGMCMLSWWCLDALYRAPCLSCKHFDAWEQ